MGESRVHRAVSDDGTEIIGTVHGQGPPLVLVHSALADGDREFAALLPWRREHFTCHLPSTRCRGRSGHSDDLSPGRLVEDVTAYVDSVGEPVRVAGVSGGGMNALAAAARSAAVTAVAAWEPVVFEVITEEIAASFEAVMERVAAQVEAGDRLAAARTFLSFVGNDREMAALATSGELEAATRYLPVDLQEVRQATAATGPGPTDPSVLVKVTAPVLLLTGTESRLSEWFDAGAQFAAAHLPDARVRTVAGAGHLTYQVTPEPVARELLEFLAVVPAP